MNCFLSVLIGVIIVVAVLVAFGIQQTKNYLDFSIQESCSSTAYQIYPLPYKFDFGYSQELSKFLFTLSMNVSRSNCSNLGKIRIPPNFTAVAVYGTSPPQRMYCYFLYSQINNTIIICFTGTIFWDEWEYDLDFSQIPPKGIAGYQNGMLSHTGITEIYLNIQQSLLSLLSSYLKPSTKIFVCGHSLGGALATLCSFDLSNKNLNLNTYTFAAPRCMNEKMAEKYDSTKCFRTFNTEDIVPVLPFSVMPYEGSMYSHIGIPIPFTLNLETFVDNHTKAYELFLK